MKMVTVRMRRSLGYQGTMYHPGEHVDIPEGLQNLINAEVNPRPETDEEAKTVKPTPVRGSSKNKDADVKE